MKSKALTAAKLNFRNMGTPILVTGIVVGVMLVQDIVYGFMAIFGSDAGDTNMTVGIGNFFYLLVAMAAICFPAQNFRRMMNLGAKRNDFFVGCGVNYVVLSAAVSLLGIVLYYTYEAFVNVNFYSGETLNVLYHFGWGAHGPIVAFFQQFAFLVLVAAFAHTLTLAQTRWYGWVADAVVVAIIAVFTPIEPLRNALIWFFNLIIFQSNAFIQIGCCLGLAVVFYALSKPMLSRKAI